MQVPQVIDIDKERVRRNFNRYATQYDHYAVVQRWMGDELLRYIHEALWYEPPRRILEIGCGTGALTAQLLDRFPEAQLTVLDLSDRMIEETRKRVAPLDQSQMTFLVGDIEEWARKEAKAMQGGMMTRKNGYDLIVSNATFQWLNTPLDTCHALMKLLEAGGGMAFATFGPRTFYELHDSFARAEQELSLPHTPHGQGYLDEQAWRDIFTAHERNVGNAGSFQWNESLYRMEYPHVEDFLYSVKRIGAGNAVKHSLKQGVNRALFRAMGEQYRQNYPAHSGTGIKVTYDVGVGIYRSTP